jgi:hypothetical protein
VSCKKGIATEQNSLYGQRASEKKRKLKGRKYELEYDKR